MGGRVRLRQANGTSALRVRVGRFRMRPTFMPCDGTASKQRASNPGSLARGEESERAGFLFPQRSWTADERTAAKIKSQQAVCIPRDADSDAFADFAGFVIAVSEPQRAFSAKIEPIQPTIDLQRRGEPSWPARQVAQPLDVTNSLHDRDALARL
jgi:hypothetical protein